MKKLLLGLALTTAAFSSASAYDQSILLTNYGHVYDMNDYKDQTYLSFMEKVIKPAMDEIATNGYKVAGADSVEATYNNVDAKVQRVVKSAGGLANVKNIANKLRGTTVTLETLPTEIAKIDRKVNRYNLATFLGLASGGGVVIRHYNGNYSYNIHYDTVEQKSGRSFGASPVRPPNDASDSAYLDDLNEYARVTGTKNLPKFYKALLESLLNTDSQAYADVIDDGQNVLTDFLAVYTAEQARNLMDGRITTHWDAALLEVTLLASFHAGQKSFKFYYQNPQTQQTSFTNKVFNQTPCAVPERQRLATMRDYWQFSRRITDEKNCKRSGINVTKAEFRRLGSAITAYMAKKNPQLVSKLSKAMGLRAKSKNLYYDLSKMLINSRTPKQLGAKAYEISSAWVQFLTQVTQEAEKITAQLAVN